MLTSLHIENMAVMARADADFSTGLSAVTGETGSGKSVLVDCLLFLLGGKPARDLLRSGEEKGTVSAVFSAPGDECSAYLADMGFEAGEELLLQRTLSADGKTQARLDGRVITGAMLRDVARYLVSVHGQNDNQMLLQKPAQAKILDGVADLGGDRSVYEAAYRRYTAAVAALSSLQKDSAEKERLRDILQYQIAEIDAAHLTAGEAEELTARRAKLQHAEKIAQNSEFAYRVLYGNEKGNVVSLLERASQALSQLSDVVPEAGACAEKLTAMRYEAEDVAMTAHDFAGAEEGDPTAALDRVEARLDLIAKLRRKYGANIGEILSFRASAAAKLAGLDNAEEERVRLQEEIDASFAVMQKAGDRLHKARLTAAKTLSDGVLRELAFLDMPSVSFAVTVEKTENYGPAGYDEITFCIATNPGEPMLPLSRVASGGELARVMLALKSVLNDRDGVGTAVFDEVDTGISGKTARKIGIKLAEIGKKTQVLCVTHSAQIASLATAHYKIVKTEQEGRARSVVVPLDEAGRRAEVARILGGLAVTPAQVAAAADMIEEGRPYR